MRVYDFLKIHVDSIIGTNNITKSTYNPNKIKETINQDDQNKHESTKINNDTAVENWRRLGEDNEKNKEKMGNYLDKNSTILHQNESSQTKSTVIGLLRNGNCSNVLQVKIDGSYYTGSNTCLYDTIF